MLKLIMRQIFRRMFKLRRFKLGWFLAKNLCKPTNHVICINLFIYQLKIYCTYARFVVTVQCLYSVPRSKRKTFRMCSTYENNLKSRINIDPETVFLCFLKKNVYLKKVLGYINKLLYP